MILICDLGLSLKKYFLFSERINDKTDFVSDESLTMPLGEGYNLARVLLSFSEAHSLLGFSGASVGGDIQISLSHSLINLNLIPIKEKSSEQIVLDFDNKKIRIKDKQPKISREELQNFYSEYKEGLNTNELICLVGEYPSNIPSEMIFEMVDLSNKWGRKLFLAVKDEGFINAIEAVPYTLLINKNTLEDITNLSLNFENEIIKSCRHLLDKGIRHIIIDNNENGIIVLNDQYGYKLSVPLNYKDIKISYGAILGGFSLSMSRNYDMDTLCKLSYACGLVNFEDLNRDLEGTDIKALMKVIESSRFNNI